MSDKHLGMGVMLNMLAGNETSVKALKQGLNKKITALSLNDDDALHFVFEDDYKMKLFDDGQSCCESRYMRTDDNLKDFIGSILLDAEIKDGPKMPAEYDVHETQFLHIKTSKGVFTMTTHNEHNGYYGGFWVIAKVE